jgi:DNA-binding PadR family transcriptional regulator
MKWLSRKEEFILLAVTYLSEDAYGVSIRKYLNRVTGRYWSIGATYDVLDRLIRKGCLTSLEAESTPERGGKSKRYYRITDKGNRVLKELHEMQKALQENRLKPIPKTGESG